MRRVLALGAALALDAVVGQPTPHPVAGIGRLLATARDRRRGHSPILALLEGAVALGAVTLGTATIAGAVARRSETLRPRSLGVTTEAVALQPALALEALIEAGEEVSAALRVDDLAEARRVLAWHLVSRGTDTLSRQLVASAAIESMGENLCDSVVAPACAYLAAGLPGAWSYRVVNTADAMVGYRTPDFEWYGKPAARTDDLLNLGPARLTAFLIRAACPFPADRRWERLAEEARRAAGPNAGWPMAALAFALDVRLEKPGAYRLNDGGRTPDASDIERAGALVRRATWLGYSSFLACAFVRSVTPPAPRRSAGTSP